MKSELEEWDSSMSTEDLVSVLKTINEAYELLQQSAAGKMETIFSNNPVRFSSLGFSDRDMESVVEHPDVKLSVALTRAKDRIEDLIARRVDEKKEN